MRMFDGGCDPLYVARRAVRMAVEDVGLADPRAMRMTLDAWEAYDRAQQPGRRAGDRQAIVFIGGGAEEQRGLRRRRRGAGGRRMRHARRAVAVPEMRPRGGRLCSELGQRSGLPLRPTTNRTRMRPANVACRMKMPDRRHSSLRPRGLEIADRRSLAPMPRNRDPSRNVLSGQPRRHGRPAGAGYACVRPQRECAQPVADPSLGRAAYDLPGGTDAHRGGCEPEAARRSHRQACGDPHPAGRSRSDAAFCQLKMRPADL